jgi:hypothetical protein
LQRKARICVLLVFKEVHIWRLLKHTPLFQQSKCVFLSSRNHLILSLQAPPCH